MRPLLMSRIAASATIAVAVFLGVSAAASLTPTPLLMGVIVLVLLASGLVVLRASAGPAETSESQLRRDFSRGFEPAGFKHTIGAVGAMDSHAEAGKSAAVNDDEGTYLVATVRSSAGGADRLHQDLQRVLAGIVKDERGRIVEWNGDQLVALFKQRNHARSAIDSAQRMISNVDALARRLEREVRISVGVHTGDADAISMAKQVEELTLRNGVSALISGETFSRLEEPAGLAFVDDQPVRLFGFAPVQRRLPGF